MDTGELFRACRSGDLARVRYLVETKEVDVNVRDSWDSTPLYYACLCGHAPVAEYLLEVGAQCQANTFDAERCVYAALTDEIRRMLLNRQVLTGRTTRPDLYQQLLTRLLEQQAFSDVTFVVHGAPFPAHRCVLAARSAYFREMLHTRWQHRRTVTLNNQLVQASALAAVLQYLYTGRLEVPVADADSCMLLASQCRLPELRDRLQRHLDKVDQFLSGKPGTRVTQLVLEPPEAQAELARDFGALAQLSVCGEAAPPYADLCFVVEQRRFPVHKAFFCGRSEYFRALLRDPFGEASSEAAAAARQGEGEGDHPLPVVTLRNVTADVFSCVVHYVYQNATQLTEVTVLDVLCAADVYLLPGLKRLCGLHLATLLDSENVLPLLRTARLFQLVRLEDACTQFIAENLEQILGPLTDPLAEARLAPAGPRSVLLTRSEVAVRSKLRRMGTAGGGGHGAPDDERPRSLEEVVVQLEPSPTPPPRSPAPAPVHERPVTGRSATLPRAAPTPCFHRPPPPPLSPVPVSVTCPAAEAPVTDRHSVGSAGTEAGRHTETGLCGVPTTELRSLAVSFCVLMVMLSGLAVVYGYFMRY